MNKFIYIFTFLAAILFISNSYGQVEKGDRVLGFNLSLSSTFAEETPVTPAGITYTASMLLSYERFVTKNLSIGIAPLGNVTFGESIETSGGVGGSVFASFSFLTSSGKVLPYVSAQYSYLLLLIEDTDNLENGSAGPSAGIKVFLSENTNIDIRLSYTLGVHNNNEFLDPNDVLTLGVGVSIILPKK